MRGMYTDAPYLLVMFFCFLMGGCGQKNPSEPTDKYNKGTIYISCDESFKPVIDAEVEVYKASFTDTKIIVHYKPEAECLRDFLVDSIRMVIATRGFTEGEARLIRDSLKTDPEKRLIARDLSAVIVNPGAIDSFFCMRDIKEL